MTIHEFTNPYASPKLSGFQGFKYEDFPKVYENEHWLCRIGQWLGEW